MAAAGDNVEFGHDLPLWFAGGGSTYAQLEGSGSPRQVIHDFLPNKNHKRVGPVRAGDILADNLRLVARISKMT